MNSKVKKMIFGSAVTTLMVFGVYFLLGGYSALAAGPYGHDPRRMELRGDFGGHHVMYGHHHGGGFSWWGLLLFLIIGMTVFVFFVKWLRKKAKAASMQQFIDTSIMTSHQPIMSQNESMLDQWEKTIVNKKEKL